MQSLSQARLWVFLEKSRVRVRKVLWFLCGSPERGLGWTRAGAVEWGREVVGRGMQDSGREWDARWLSQGEMLRPVWGPSGGMGGQGTFRRRHPGGHRGLAFYKWKQLRTGEGLSKANHLDKEENSAVPSSSFPVWGIGAWDPMRACMLSHFSHVPLFGTL